MPPRHGSRQIATPPVERTQYTTSSEPDDEEGSTSNPRQASGNYYESEQSPEVTREPSGGRTLSGIDEEIGTLWKLLLELGLQGFDYENLRQRAECITRLQELEREFSNLITPSQTDLASPQPPVENPENSETNLKEHSYVYNVIITVLCTEVAPEGSVGAVSVEDGAGVKFWTITQRDGRPSKTYSPTMSP
jgi:hypothetical protein